MLQSLPSHLVELIDEREPSHGCSISEFCDWFTASGEQLVVVVDEFSAAKSYAAAIATHVVLDILLARILLTCYKVRLNRAVPR